MTSSVFALTATAASLAMDAFSVSICLGLCHEKLSHREALLLGLTCGLFQFLMPLAGGELADHLTGLFDSWTPWIAAALIIWVAVNMIREAGSSQDKTRSCMTFTLKNVLVLAFATSLDALAVGFSIEITGGSAFTLAVLAGIITFVLSTLGALLGKKLGQHFGQKAEYFGGVVLLIIAAKVIFDAWQS